MLQEFQGGKFSTEKMTSKTFFMAEGNVSALRASDLVISRGFPEFGPSKKGNYSFCGSAKTPSLDPFWISLL